MSPRFEAFIAQLYVDAAARARFVRDPRGEATSAGLIGDEIAAAMRIDRVGLELAAVGFAHKRRPGARRASRVRRWERILGRIFRGA